MPSSNVQRYWAGVLQRLRAEVDVFSSLVRHYGERGRANELAFAQVLERFLPARWAVGTGVLVDRHGRQSRQMDIVVYERSDQPAIFAQTTQLLHPVETVVACIEVKTTVTKKDVETDLEAKLSSIAELAPADGYSRPLFILVAYKSQPSPQSLGELFIAPKQDKRVDLACVLNWCMLAGTAETLGQEALYRVGNCLMQERDGAGKPTGDYIATDSREREIPIDGMLVPVVRRGDARYVGDPGRALLLFVEALTRAGATRRGQPAPILSSYLDAEARELLDIEAARLPLVRAPSRR
jgi:hypothetical protein